MYSEFCDRMRVIREKRELSQGDMAEALELSQSHISAWENGHRVPSVANVVKICRALKVSSDELLGLSPILEPV